MLRNLAIGIVLVAAAAAPSSGQGRADTPTRGTAVETRNQTVRVTEVTAPAEVMPQEMAPGGEAGAAPRPSVKSDAHTPAGAPGSPRPGKFGAEEEEAGGHDAVNGRTGFRWGPAIKQSLLFLAVQHGYALTQPKTRRDLKGPFLRDYFSSVKSLGKWDDGGRFFTNYVAHPMQGSLTGFIQVHNDPRGARRQFGRSPAYWKSRMKALAWSAVWSTQFEIGPVSQASIGNVGLHGKQTYVDLVMTPTAGLGLLVTEDALDRYVISRIERATDNFYVKIGSRMLLNPTRSVANLLRFSKPWRRDR